MYLYDIELFLGMPKKFSSVFDISVRRENWNGKYRVVARTFNGKLKSWTSYSSKVNINVYKQRFRDSNKISFKENVRGIVLSNVVEVSDYSDNFKKPRKGQAEKYQYVVKGVMKGMKTIYGRSDYFSRDVPIRDARDQALERFYSLLADVNDRPYDEGEGRKLANELGNRLKIQEGVIYYKPRV